MNFDQFLSRAVSDCVNARPPLNPGSPEAVARGCTCPVLDNAHGAGRGCDGERFGWWRSADCPLHGGIERGGYLIQVERDEDGKAARMTFTRTSDK